MLAPDDLDPITRSLTSVYAETRWADELVNAGGNFQVFDISGETTWVESMRTRLAMLDKDAKAWQECKVSAVSLAFSPFLRYYNTFCTTSAALQSGVSKETMLETLDRLCNAANGCAANARTARLQFQEWVNQAAVHVSGVEDSIRDAWSALGGAEKKTVELSQQIVAVQDELRQLSGVIAPDQLSSKTISSLSTVLTNTASLVYSVTIAGLPIPYLSVVSTFFTLGKLFYTIFSTDKAVHEKILQLAEYRTELSAAHRSLAQTKAALVSLYRIKELIVTQQESIVDLEAFWQNEVRNITTVRNRFALSPSISSDDPELCQLPMAEAVWGTLKKRSQALLSNLEQGVDSKTQISITI